MLKRMKSWLCFLLCIGVVTPFLPALPARAAEQTLFDISNGTITINVYEEKTEVPPAEEGDPVTYEYRLLLRVHQQGFPWVTYEDFSTLITIGGQSQTNQVIIDTRLKFNQYEGTYPNPGDLAFTVNVQFNGIYIDSRTKPAVEINRGSEANITFSGVNTLISGADNPGMKVEAGSSVTLTGEIDASGLLGSLRAYGGANAAGIGGTSSVESGNITIKGGFITAKGDAGFYDIGSGTQVVEILGGSVWPVNGKISSPRNSTTFLPTQPLYPVWVPIRRGTESLMGLEVSGSEFDGQSASGGKVPMIEKNGLTRTVSTAKEHGEEFPKHMSALVWLPLGDHRGFQVGGYTGGMATVVAGDKPDWDQNRIYWGYQPEPAFDISQGDIIIFRHFLSGRLAVSYGDSTKKPATIYAEEQIQIYGKPVADGGDKRIIVNGEGIFSTVKLELVDLSLNSNSPRGKTEVILKVDYEDDDEVGVNVTAHDAMKGAALELQNRADVAIEVLGDNELKSTQSEGAIHVPSGARLTINGPVGYRLKATSAGGGAGIGGGDGEAGGTIIINGGTVVATGSKGGSGIGGGSGGSSGKVTINGGIVIAQGNSNAFDIGSGSGEVIGLGTEINGGNIYCAKQARSTKFDEIIEGATNGRTPVYPVTVPYEYRGLQYISSPVRYEAYTITDQLAYGTVFPYQISACIWIPEGEYDGTITVGAAEGGCATVVETPNRDQNIVYWKSVIIVTDSLLSGTVGQYYTYDLVSINNARGTWSITAGSLPDGLELSGSTISGTPTRAATYTFTVHILLTTGESETRNLSILINRAPFTPEQPGSFHDKDQDPVVNPSTGTRRITTDSGNLTLPYSRVGTVFTFVIDHDDSTRIINLANRQVTFDVSDLSNVDSVSMSKSCLNRLRDAGLVVNIALPLGTIVLTPPAAGALVQKSSDQVTFTIKKENSANLNRDQRNAAGSNAVYQIAAYTGTEQITVFDAAVTVKLTYGISSGYQNFSVWYLDRLGQTETVNYTYDYNKRVLTFQTRNLSHFIVGYDSSWHSPFYDVSSSDWFYNDVRYMVLNGIDTGTAENTYNPYGQLTRATLVTMLGRMSGVNINQYANSGFSDVPASAAYTKYVEWARSNNIVTGVGTNRFEPNRTVTREEMAVFLVRYNSYMNKTLPTLRNAITFSDSNTINSWARESVTLVYRANIMNEYTGTAFNPRGTVTRAEVSAILHRYSQQVT